MEERKFWRSRSAPGLLSHTTVSPLSPHLQPRVQQLKQKNPGGSKSQQAGNKRGKGLFQLQEPKGPNLSCLGSSAVSGTQQGEGSSVLASTGGGEGKPLESNGSVTTLWPSQQCGCDMQSPGTPLGTAGYSWGAKQGPEQSDSLRLKQINKQTGFGIIMRHICIKKSWLFC